MVTGWDYCMLVGWRFLNCPVERISLATAKLPRPSLQQMSAKINGVDEPCRGDTHTYT